MEFGVWGLGFGVWGLGFGVHSCLFALFALCFFFFFFFWGGGGGLRALGFGYWAVGFKVIGVWGLFGACLGLASPPPPPPNRPATTRGVSQVPSFVDPKASEKAPSAVLQGEKITHMQE